MNISAVRDYCVNGGAFLWNFCKGAPGAVLGFVADHVVHKPLDDIANKVIKSIAEVINRTSGEINQTIRHSVEKMCSTVAENTNKVMAGVWGGLTVSSIVVAKRGIAQINEITCVTGIREDLLCNISRYTNYILLNGCVIAVLLAGVNFYRAAKALRLQKAEFAPVDGATVFAIPVAQYQPLRGSDDCVALMEASSQGDLKKIIELQRKGVCLEIYDANGKTALHYAAEHQQRKVIDLLWYYGCNLHVATKDTQSKLPIHFLSRWRPLHSHVLKLMNTPNRFNLPEQSIYPFYRPENLVFKGGGPKGIAYVGVGKYLEQEQILPGIRRVAGTSAGAINAVLVAFGYSAEAMEKIILAKDLLDFLDHPLIKEIQATRGLFNVLNSPGNITLKNLWDGIVTIAEWRNFCQADNQSDLLKAALSEIVNKGGICPGDKLREWIDKLIQEKTGIEYCTFKQLRELIHSGKPFRHLHLFTTNITDKSVICINSEESRWDDVIISSAVRASMSIPGVFKPYRLQVKIHAEPREAVEPNLAGQFVDGGLIKNCPVNAFDALHYFSPNPTVTTGAHTNWQTLAFNLMDPEVRAENNEDMRLQGVAANAVDIIYGAEDLNHRQNPADASRMVNIDNQGMTLLKGFFATQEEKKARIVAGYDATKAFFEEQKKRAEAYAHCDPRKLLDKDVVEALFGVFGQVMEAQEVFNGENGGDQQLRQQREIDPVPPQLVGPQVQPPEQNVVQIAEDGVIAQETIEKWQQNSIKTAALLRKIKAGAVREKWS